MKQDELLVLKNVVRTLKNWIDYSYLPPEEDVAALQDAENLLAKYGVTAEATDDEKERVSALLPGGV